MLKALVLCVKCLTFLFNFLETLDITRNLKTEDLLRLDARRIEMVRQDGLLSQCFKVIKVGSDTVLSQS